MVLFSAGIRLYARPCLKMLSSRPLSPCSSSNIGSAVAKKITSRTSHHHTIHLLSSSMAASISLSVFRLLGTRGSGRFVRRFSPIQSSAAEDRQPENWVCQGCGMQNFAASTSCQRCGWLRQSLTQELNLQSKDDSCSQCCGYCGEEGPVKQLPVGEICAKCEENLDWHLKKHPFKLHLPMRNRGWIRVKDEGCCPVCHIGPHEGHPLVVSPHTHRPVSCCSRGFQRTHERFSKTQRERQTREMLSSYAAIYTHGLGRWDRSSSLVDGLITYGVQTCVAICVVDSPYCPSRASLMHGPMAHCWCERISQEVAWVGQSEASCGPTSVFVFKGMGFALDLESLTETELRWELTDMVLPSISAACPASTQIRLVHEPLWCGALAVGCSGILAPTVPHVPPYGEFAIEMPIEDIARRHCAFYDMDYSSTGTDLDMQFCVSEHVAASLPSVVALMQQRQATPVNRLPHLPILGVNW